MSNMQDVKTFIEFVEEFFVDHTEVSLQGETSPILGGDLYIETLTIFPIKSCGGWEVPQGILWDVSAEGLAWDRQWCLVHQGTRTALSQKKFPKMALLSPSLDLDEGLLRVRTHGPVPSAMPKEILVPLSADPGLFQTCAVKLPLSTSQVCGEDILVQTYKSPQIAEFFTTLIGAPCTLARFPAAVAGLSRSHSKAHLDAPSNATPTSQPPEIMQNQTLLSNESPILTISRSSVNRLNEQIKFKDGKAAHASVFRANIIVAEDPASSPGSEKPYVEDDWHFLRIGHNVNLNVLGGCHRCQVVCVDQYSAEKNEEPFVTLAKTRRKNGKVFFGVHTALAETERGQLNQIRVGDRVCPT